MKKCLIVVLFCFILAGCSGKINIDFSDQIETKINFSFTTQEYATEKGISENEVNGQVEAIINEARPIMNSYDEMFEEIKYSNENNKIEGEYKYTYTYSNFKDTALLKRCFEYAAIEDDENKIYVYLKGSSDCAGAELRIKANNRMLSNNAQEKSGNEYIWKIQKENNDIHFNINKEQVKNKLFNFKNILLILLAIAVIVGIIVFKKKTNK